MVDLDMVNHCTALTGLVDREESYTWQVRSWRRKMKAYEYYAEVLPDGHLSIPEDLREKVKADSKVRVMLLLEDEDAAWDKLTISQFTKGYSEKDSIYDSL